jgi:hypothetical protein
MKRTSILLVFLVFMTIPFVTVYAGTINCNGGIVSVGDSRVNLVIKCGEPDWKDSHEEEIIKRFNNKSKRKKIITKEEWTYNFGPSQFMRIITIKNGKVADIRTGGYGSRKAEKPQPHEFSDRIVSIGESSGEVIAKWGEPAARNTRQEKLKERLSDGKFRTITITIDEWTYNLGPNRFMRILTFKNGKLTDINTGGYGYDRKQERH